MRSVYFPTDLLAANDGKDGLLPSGQEALKSIAESFKQYTVYTPSAHLTLSGHADERGPGEYNQALSESVQLVKSFLVEQGIPANTLDTQAFGKTQNMRADQVRELLQQNSRRADLARLHPVVLANNRRVDIAVSTGQESLSQYQYKAEDFANLIDRNGPRMATGLQ